MTKFPKKIACLVAVGAGLPLVASAHPAHEASATLMQGLMHPLTGVDHLLAMLAVGLWAGQLQDRRRLWVPVAFTAVMLVGSCLSLHGSLPSGIDQMIAATVVASGLLLAFAVRLPVAVAAPLAGAFAAFHGYAHGAEAPLAGEARYLAGLIISTLVITVASALVAPKLASLARYRPLRWTGLAIAGAGALLLSA